MTSDYPPAVWGVPHKDKFLRFLTGPKCKIESFIFDSWSCGGRIIRKDGDNDDGRGSGSVLLVKGWIF